MLSATVNPDEIGAGTAEPLGSCVLQELLDKCKCIGQGEKGDCYLQFHGDSHKGNMERFGVHRSQSRAAKVQSISR